jgi:hypothetical protein
MAAHFGALQYSDVPNHCDPPGHTGIAPVVVMLCLREVTAASYGWRGYVRTLDTSSESLLSGRALHRRQGLRHRPRGPGARCSTISSSTACTDGRHPGLQAHIREQLTASSVQTPHLTLPCSPSTDSYSDRLVRKNVFSSLLD